MAELQPRIEGSTIPNLVETISIDGVTITDGTDYTWTCEGSASTTASAKLWTKSTNITASAGGFTCVWTASDMGAFTTTGPASTTYVVEFTGTASGGRTLKLQHTIKILPQVS